MGKKTKVGKGRLDKYYHLAKDQGYRARSAFKLIQLAKKTDFLGSARICIDLCAAPGGWAQVAQKNMPANSQILAIDLVPIKPIHGVTCIMSDITSEKCRSILKKELKGNKADVVLHDGAPNVGANWSADAYGQNVLTLHSCKLACEHLRQGGTFVTKVFRSSDYNSLMWVFNQLFTKVDATKPSASRNVSAEIFVICGGFKAGKIDARFFDAKWVFMEVVKPAEPGDPDEECKKPGASLAKYLKNAEKRHRSGYEEGENLRIIAAEAFIATSTPAEVLVTHSVINLKAPGSESLLTHPLTDEEVQTACADLKVCGKRELSLLLKWRAKVRRAREKEERTAKKAERDRAGKVTADPDDAAGSSKSSAAAAAAIASNLDDAIDGLLEEDRIAASSKHQKPAADQSDDPDDDLEQELAQQVEKRRKDQRREAKKTMERQKKAEMRKKISYGGASMLQDQPELFEAGTKGLQALKDEDTYVTPKADIMEEDSMDEKEDSSESDSDEGLDRYAKMEVDIAIGEQLRKNGYHSKNRNKLQRQMKKKKESRRERVMAAWSGEMGAFSEALENQSATAYSKAMKDAEGASDGDEDDDDDDDGEDLKALRDLQSKQTGGNLDGEALAGLMDGPGRPLAIGGKDADEDSAGSGVEGGPVRVKRKNKQETALALEPEEGGEEALRSEHRRSRWFSQDIFKGAMMPVDKDSDSDASSDEDEEGKIQELADSELPQLPITDKMARHLKRKKEQERNQARGKGRKMTEAEEPMEVAPLEAPKPLVPAGAVSASKKPTDPHELAETLAIGSLLVNSKKSRMEIMDAAYNRWTFDRDDSLPDWFTEEENKYNKPELPISKELMDQFRAKLREINARPIRKVTEARARKKKRLGKRLEKLRSTAMALDETPDMSSAAKARQMRRAVNKLAKAEERKVTVVAIKKGGGGKRVNKTAPKGAKVKVVDKRMKSDIRGLKKAAKRNKGKFKGKVKRQMLKKSEGGHGGRKSKGPKMRRPGPARNGTA